MAVRLGEALGLADPDLRATYYQALLRYIGCNADTQLLAALVGDELAFRTEAIHLKNPSPELFSLFMRFVRQANEGASTVQVAQAMVSGLLSMNNLQQEFFTGHCEVAQRLAQRLGFEPAVVQALGQVYARWDGRGIPAIKGEAIAPRV